MKKERKQQSKEKKKKKRVAKVFKAERLFHKSFLRLPTFFYFFFLETNIVRGRDLGPIVRLKMC